MKKRAIFLQTALALTLLQNAVYAEKTVETPIYFNGSLMEFSNLPIIEEGCTIVPIRELSEKAGFKVFWNDIERSIGAYNDNIQVTMRIGDKRIYVLSSEGEEREVESILPPEIINSVTYVPLRTVSEAFGAEVLWNEAENNISIHLNDTGAASENKTVNAEIVQEEYVFYSQYDPEYISLYSQAPYNWTAGKNGYCYVVSYAMLLSQLNGAEITPKMVADINYEAGGDPRVCYHSLIVGAYGRKLVKAIDETSQYFKSYDSGRGLTYIDNSSRGNVIAAIKEALERNPEGVMVRDTSMPHTMVATRVVGDNVYFNDPAQLTGNVLWEETCLRSRDMTTIAALIAID